MFSMSVCYMLKCNIWTVSLLVLQSEQLPSYTISNTTRTTLVRVPEQITFKLASLVFWCLNGTAPVYLADSITRAAYVDTRRSLRLRSSSSTAVVVPVTRRSMIGDCTFPVAAARAWNSLPSFVTSATSLSTFKQHLKTYLFASSYWWCWPLLHCLCFHLGLAITSPFSLILFVTCPWSFRTKCHVNLFVNNNNNNNYVCNIHLSMIVYLLLY